MEINRRRNNIILYSQRTSDRFYSTGSPQKVTCHRFRRTDIQLVSMLAKRFQDSCRFGDISQPGRSTVYIDIIDIFGFHTCIFKSQQHHFIGPVRIRSGHMISVAVSGTPCNLCIDMCTSGHSMFILFKNQGSSTFTDHKTIPVCIERTGSCLRVIVAG